ncbi:MAG: CvpA family protein [Holosporales bacterium]|jgi:membrane protein required for colicin V production|nr:CvpA family protein [Holosporales bacterium]
MNIVDVFLLGIVFVTLLIGFWRGFIREFSSIMAWILAGVATFWDIPILRTFIRSKIESALISDVITGVCVFIIAFVIISLIGTICAGFVRGTILSPIDRSLGGMLGGAKGAFLICSASIIAECFVLRSEMPELVAKSFVMNFYVYGMSDALYPFLPEPVREYLTKLRNNNFAPLEVVPKSNNGASNEDVEVLGTLKPKISSEKWTKRQESRAHQEISQHFFWQGSPNYIICNSRPVSPPLLRL